MTQMKNTRPARSTSYRTIDDCGITSKFQQFTAANILRRQLEKARHEVAAAHDLRKENAELFNKLKVLEEIDSIVPAPPDWTVPTSLKGKLHHCIPTLMLSDWHFDEVVNREEMNGVNEYNRTIAVKRLRHVTTGTITMLRARFADMRFDGFNLIFGGDMLSGQIHDELIQTNEDTIISSVDFWVDHLVAVVEALLEEFGRVHVTAITGNHGRNTRKPRHKLRVKDNFDWLLSRIIARYFSKDSRVTFHIPESPDTIIKLYQTNYLLMHGDQFRGGAGISAMLAPLMLGKARRALQGMALGTPHDWLVMGHRHTWWCGLGVIVNGSGKGYDEFAKDEGFTPERPQQGLWVTTPENRGPTFAMPIFATKDDIRV
jgi:hypothetical protein